MATHIEGQKMSDLLLACEIETALRVKREAEEKRLAAWRADFEARERAKVEEKEKNKSLLDSIFDNKI